MRPLVLVLAAALAGLFSSCECAFSKVGCGPDDYSGHFRIVSAATGQDLVFGSNGIYDENQIKFYSLNGTDTTFHPSRPAWYGAAAYDSIMVVDFSSRAGVAFMRLGNGDIDTLQITYASVDRKCCSMYNYIAEFRFNGGQPLPGNQGPQELKK